MPRNAYVKGQQVNVSDVLTLVATGALVDPTTVVCTITKPDGTTATPAVVHDSTGKYHAVVDTTGGPQGNWQYLFTGTGAVISSGYGTFWVDDPAFP
jgi:hypothetical protein